jgi:sulfur-oxidizing protein SoxB
LSLAQGRTLARDVSGLDVICVNDVALPDAVEVGQTRVLSSGTQGRFVTRFDFDLIDGKIGEVEQVLIPVFADIIPPTPRIATKVRKARAPFEDALDRQLGIAGTVLYHADAVRCSWGDLICEAVRVELGCDMVLWPASDAGRTVRAGQAVRRSDVFSVTGKARMRTVQIKGGALKGLLEDEAQKVLAKTRYDVRRSGMVRVGGLAFTLDFTQTKGRRIRDLRLASGASLGPTRSYTLATTDLASGGDPEVANLVEGYISQRGRVGQGLASPIRVILPEV